MLNKEQFLSRSYKTAEVQVDDDGGAVLVRELSGAEGQEMHRLASQGKDGAALLAWIACKAIVNEDGSRMFTDKELGTVEAQPLKLLNAVAETSLKLSGMHKDHSTTDEKKG